MHGLRVLLAAILVLVASSAGADDQPSASPLERLDNGDYSWARQIVPILYGRKPHGYSEIRLIADLARATDRRSTLLALMSSEEYIDHWTDVMMEHLRVNRVGDKALNECYSRLDYNAGKSADLAKWLRDNPPENQLSGPGFEVFNMNDVVRSSLRLDDLSPIFLTHLFALASKPMSGNQATETNRRADLWSSFEATYLNRKNECLLCHNSSFSVTGDESYWNRSHVIPGHFENSVYGARTGLDPVRLRSFFRTDIANPPNADPSCPKVPEPTLSPWSLDWCGSFRRPTTDDQEPPKCDDANGTGVANDPLFAGMSSPRGSIYDIERLLRDGFNRLRANGMLNRTVDPSDEKYCRLCQSCATQPIEVVLSPEQLQQRDAATRVLDSRCKSCHLVGGRLPALVGVNLIDDIVRGPSSKCMLVAPGDKEHSYLWQKVQPNVEGECSRVANRMPLAAEPLTAEELGTIEKWIAGLPQNAGCKTCQRLASRCDPVPKLKVDAREGLALMVASGMTNRVWREALGYPLTIANYFPRSYDQGAMLRVLSETTFISNHFSLKELLVHILTSAYFNRSPADAQGNAYVVPLVSDPWVEADTRRPPVALDGWRPGAGSPTPDPAYDPASKPQNHKNAATEAIRRYPAYTLLRSVREALGWPAVPNFWVDDPEDGSLEYAKAAGLFIRDSEPGFRGISLESLLVWEARNGTCERPKDVPQDWIDRLIEEAEKLKASNPESPVSNREVAAAVKDWLVGTLSIDDGREAEAVAKLLGWAKSSAASANQFLDSPASLGSDLNANVRKFCGILLESPQFQLAGMGAVELHPPLHDATALEPRLRVCNGQPCGYQELCKALVSHWPPNGSSVSCNRQGSAQIVASGLSPSEARASAELDSICPPGLCYLQKLPQVCRNKPEGCAGQVAFCDPRIDDCGAPKTPAGRLQALREGAVLVSELEGAEIVDATPNIRYGDIKGASILASRNRRLSAGDVLRIETGQRLTVEASKRAAPSPAGSAMPNRWSLQIVQAAGAGDAKLPDTLTVIVTGPGLRSRMVSEAAIYQPPAPSLAGEREEPWLRHGEAGLPSRSTVKAPIADSPELEKRRRALQK